MSDSDVMATIRWHRKKIFFGTGALVFAFLVYCIFHGTGKSFEPKSIGERSCNFSLSGNCTRNNNGSSADGAADGRTDAVTQETHCLTKCPGKPNCYYEPDDRRHGPFTERYTYLLASDYNKYYGAYSKVPPNIARIDRLKGGEYTLWLKIFLLTDSSKPISIKLLDGCTDLKEIAITPRKFCQIDCPEINLFIKDTQSDPVAVNFNVNINKIDSIATVVFGELPACSFFVNVNHGLYWSDGERGTIESLDLDTNVRFTLVKRLVNPGSMANDPDRGQLFWCNHVADGSVERIDFDGKNRVDITRGKYELYYPSGLTVDQYRKRLYWTANEVVHASDFDGNGHVMVTDTVAMAEYRAIGLDCIALSETREHIFYWDKNAVGDRVPSESTNFLLSVTYVPAANADDETVAPSSDDDKRCSHTCAKNSAGYRCVCLKSGGGDDKTRRLDVPDYLLNSTLSSLGYVPLATRGSPAPFDAGVLDELAGASFDFDSRTHDVYYHDAEARQIRSINTLVKTKVPLTILKNITIPNNGLAYDWINNNLYFIDSAEQNIKVLRLNDFNTTQIINAEKNSSLNAIAIHPRKSLLFFIRKNSNSKIIYKSALDGTSLFIVTEISEGAADVLIIDPKENMIYWTNVEENLVEKIDFDGNYRETYTSPRLYPFIIKLNNNYILSNKRVENSITVSQFKLIETNAEENSTFGSVNIYRNESRLPNEIKWKEGLMHHVGIILLILVLLTVAAYVHNYQNIQFLRILFHI